MSAPIPTTEPASLIAGDTVRWLKHLPDYLPADGWQLSYQLVNAQHTITIESTPSGDSHLVRASAVESSNWGAGQYSFVARVHRGANTADTTGTTADTTEVQANDSAGPAFEQFTVLSGRMSVAPAFGATPFDARSTAQQMLDMVEAYLLDSNNLKAAKYQIAGRNLERYPLPDLLALRDKLRGEVARETAAERVAAGLPDPRRVFVRWSRP